MKNILILGTFPMEAGGRHTNGICNVVYELSKYTIDGYCVHLLAINASGNSIRRQGEQSGIRLYGYSKNIFSLFFHSIRHFYTFISACKTFSSITKMGLIRGVFYASQIQRVIDISKPSLIHSHILYLPAVANVLTKGKIPILQTYHGIFVGKNNSIKLIEDSRKYVHYATGLTNETCERLLERGFKPEQIFQVSNGVDVNKFFYSERYRKELRKDMGIENDVIVFTTVASVTERKGQYNFINIFKQLPNNSQYWIIGRGYDLERIREYVESCGLINRVKLLGYVDNNELFKYYSASDIYAHTSEEEGQALCEIEAFTTGLRILANESLKGTIVNDIHDRSTYLFYNSNCADINEIKEWMADSSRKERQTYTKFDWKKISLEYASVYNKILYDGIK